MSAGHSEESRSALDEHFGLCSTPAGRRSTWRSCQSVKASRPQSWRLRSSRPATWSSRSRVTDIGLEEPLAPQVSRESVSRANGSSSPRSQAAAGIEKPRFFPWTISRGSSGAAALRSSTFLESPRTLWRVGSASARFVTIGVEVRHASLERVRHRCAVGLHQQVVDEVDAEVDVLQPRELVGALGFGDTGRGGCRRDRMSCRAARELRAQVGARRSPSSRGGARAAEGARRGRNAWPCSRSSLSLSTSAAARRAALHSPSQSADARGE